jgi:predicted GIY-YIG superfamily endonuclease
MVEQRPFKALVVGSSPTQPKINMASVYILRGSSGRYYIGSTENLTRRLAEHRRGGNHTTHRLGADLEVVISRVVGTAVEARKIEFALKRKKNPRLAIKALEKLP